jgi:uncharacterized protein (DUF58 family)
MTFPLIPRDQLIGLSFGTMRSLRRGSGTDVAGSRPYMTGDDIRAIDWASSARFSSARQSDEFIVRERYAEESPKVVLVCDRRPGMIGFAPPLPWLDKAAAMRRAAELVIQSTLVVGGFVGYLDYAEGEAFWEPPRGGRQLSELWEQRLPSTSFSAPPDSLERSLAFLAGRRRAVSAGSFLFVFSDFLPTASASMWQTALDRRWDVIPVVIQDPIWEQSFPEASGIVLPLRDPRTGRGASVQLTAREVAEQRKVNEARLESLIEDFRAFELEPVLLSSSDPGEILASFIGWAEGRKARRAA